MRTYGQYCPIAKAAEILGDRWSILILRDMLVGSHRFNELARGLPGISRDLLTKRLRHLESANLVTRIDGGYYLTEAGLDLRPLIFGMAEWGAKWAFPEPTPDELDPDLLVWSIHGQVDYPILPGVTAVVELEFSDCATHYWLVIEPGEVSVCLTDPGLEVNVLVRSSLRTLYRVWLGRDEMAAAIRAGAIEVSGDPAMARAFQGSLRLSPASPAVRAAAVSAAR